MGCGCLSELGLLGVLWDSWDLVLVVWGIGFELALLVGGVLLAPPVHPDHPHPLPPRG